MELDFRTNRLPPFPLGEISKSVLELRALGQDVIDLSQFSPNLPPPALAVEKLLQATLQTHNHRYSSSQGILKLRQSIANWYQTNFNVELEADNEIVVTLGTKEGLSHLLFTLLSQGDSVLLPSPIYPIHSAAVSIAGANVSAVPLPEVYSESIGETPLVLSSKSDDFFDKINETHEQTWPRPKLMLVSFPHNPSTTVVTLDFFERLVALGLEKGFFIVHDFAYVDFSYDSWKTPSILQVPDAKKIAVEFCSLSKGCNLPGWRIGYASGNKSLIAALKRLKSYLDCGAFQPLQIAAVSVLQGYRDILSETTEVYQSRMDSFLPLLKSAGFSFARPLATPFVWCRMPQALAERDSITYCRELLETSKLALCPGVGFDSRADKFVRVALVESESKLREAGKRILEYHRKANA